MEKVLRASANKMKAPTAPIEQTELWGFGKGLDFIGSDSGLHQG